MPTRNVNLTEHLDTYVKAGVSSGRFSNASEVVREGLRLLEQREAEDRAKVRSLRRVTQEAFGAMDRGEGIALSSADDIDALVNDVVAEHRMARRAKHG